MRQGHVWMRSRCTVSRLLTRLRHHQTAARLRCAAWKSSARRPPTTRPRLRITRRRYLLCRASLSSNLRRGSLLRQGCLRRLKRSTALRHRHSLNKRQYMSLQLGRWRWTRTMTTAEMMTRGPLNRRVVATARDRSMVVRPRRPMAPLSRKPSRPR